MSGRAGLGRGKACNTETDMWKFVTKTSTCWLWTSAVNRKGYGKFSVNKKQWSAHRLAFFLSTGSLPKELMVLHRCDVPACVNPEHLWLGTNQDNVDDKMRKGRHACQKR